MFQPPRADVEQGQNQQRTRAAVVAGEIGARGPQPRGQADASRVAAQQLEATVRVRSCRTKLDAHMPLTTRRKLATLKRIRGPPVWGSDIGVVLPFDHTGGLFASNEPLLYLNIYFRIGV